MATPRKSISKKTRFEVFKRDGFTCQYCGAHPPAVILHVDHVVPLALDGENHIDNYVTACAPCNLGKSATSLAEVPQSLKERAAEIAEHEMQIAGYQKVMDERRLRLEDEVGQVADFYEAINPGYMLSTTALISVRKFIESIGVHAVCEALESAYTRPTVRKGAEFKYFCGICWNIIKGGKNGTRP